ncbi:MAG: hypothetical protein ACRDBM_17230 [Sporomusa sp.]
MKYSKKVKKQMRELVGIAYERELRQELEKLAAQFQLWQQSKINTFDLEHRIHQFHNGPARVLYNRYTDLPAEMVLPYALSHGLISEGECPDEIADEMRMRARVIYGE